MQVETVRLQRQYDPCLIGIYLKLAEFLSQEPISNLKIQQSLDTINLEIKDQKILVKNLLVSNISNYKFGWMGCGWVVG